MPERPAIANFPLRAILAADARLSTPDYANDLIWEFDLQGEPPALGISSSFGRRVRSMRISPAFYLNGQSVADAAQFHSPPRLARHFPNYLAVDSTPFPDLDAHLEFWVPNSHCLAGRITLRNGATQVAAARLRLQAVLRPQSAERRGGMSEASHQGSVVLSGLAPGLAPVLFLTGGASANRMPYPSLALAFDLPPGEACSSVWVLAAESDEAASFEAARALAGQAWDEAIARIELLNSTRVEIETGERAWDKAFGLGQAIGLGLAMGPTRFMRHASFIGARLPERGYSVRGDGRDYDASWDGQTAVQAYSLLPNLVYAAPEFCQGVLLNFAESRTPEGGIDWKPGLAGQRGGVLSIPLLADLTLHIFHQTGDLAWLQSMFDPLMGLVRCWFAKEHDRDGDSFPEWDHTQQSGFDHWPAFVRWARWGQGLDISTAETIDLGCYLIAECRALQAISLILDKPAEGQELDPHRKRLEQAVAEAWSSQSAIYLHRDRDSHSSPPGQELGKGSGSFVLELSQNFDTPARLLVRVEGPEGGARQLQVAIHGQDASGRRRVERLGEAQFQWFWDFGSATSTQTFASIGQLEVRGLSQDFETSIRRADLARQDITQLLPLWAGVPDQAQAETLVRQSLLDPNRFWRRFGIPAIPTSDTDYAGAAARSENGIGFPFNVMVGEGLLRYGFRREAAELIERLMGACVGNLRREGGFRAGYSADEAIGYGERNDISGLPPLDFFLHTAGIRLRTPHWVEVEGANPFPWPVVVRWRGLTVRRQGSLTHVVFPDGQQADAIGEQPCRIEQVSES
jgi:hypothetical protein